MAKFSLFLSKFFLDPIPLKADSEKEAVIEMLNFKKSARKELLSGSLKMEVKDQNEVTIASCEIKGDI